MIALDSLESTVVFFLLSAEISEHDTQILAAFEHHHQSDESEGRACDYEPDRPEQLPESHVHFPALPDCCRLGRLDRCPSQQRTNNETASRQTKSSETGHVLPPMQKEIRNDCARRSQQHRRITSRRVGATPV